MACQKCRNARVGARPVGFKHHQFAIINQCRQHRGYGGGFKDQRFIGFAGDAPISGYIDKDQLAFGAGNRTRELNVPSAPAELLAIRAACQRIGQERLANHDLYVTLEPCPMCAGLIAAARIRRLYYGATDAKSGGVGQGPRVFSHPQSHHTPEIFGGIYGAVCAGLLKAFVTRLR